jgi:hypothetical protein
LKCPEKSSSFFYPSFVLNSAGACQASAFFSEKTDGREKKGREQKFFQWTLWTRWTPREKKEETRNSFNGLYRRDGRDRREKKEETRNSSMDVLDTMALTLRKALTLTEALALLKALTLPKVLTLPEALPMALILSNPTGKLISTWAQVDPNELI